MAGAELSLLAERYAVALYDVATTNHALPQVVADVQFLERCLAESGEFNQMLGNASLTQDARLQATLAVLMQKGDVHPLTRNFLATLALNHRIAALPLVLGKLHRVMERAAGIVVVDVTTAAPLKDEYLPVVEDALRHKIGQKLRVQLHVDPSLLDGMTVRVGSILYDASLRHRLQKMEQTLLRVA